MQKKTLTRCSFVILLLGLLLITFTVLNTDSFISSNINAFAVFSGIGESEQSSMHSNANTGHDYLAAVITAGQSTGAFQLNWLGAKASSRTITATAMVLAAFLMYYYRLSDRICTQLNSIGITRILHLKDGMK